MEKNGYEITDDLERANVVIIHGCIVKEPTEKRELSLLERLQKKGKKVIVSGCLADYFPDRFIKKGIPCCGVNFLDKIVQCIEKGISFTNGKKKEKLGYPRKLRKKVCAPLVICEGCTFNCSYCAGKLVRKNLFSYSLERIKKEFVWLLQKGIKEIWITGQDVGAYGLDKGTDLVKLLKNLLEIEGEYRIRIGMMHPLSLKRIIEGIIALLNSEERIYKFIHIPLQSGSNRVLQLMRREYTKEEFEEIFLTLRKEVKNISIGTDVIVGFPTETEEEFWETVELIRKLKPDFLNVTRYWPRKGTEAYKLKPHPPELVKERSRIMSKVHREVSLKRNLEWVGWKGKVLVNEIGVKNSFISRNNSYKPVVIREFVELGSFVKVKIIEAKEFFLIGKIHNK